MIITDANIKRIVEKNAFYLKRWQRYPLGFVIECCNAAEYGYPVKWQIEMMDAVRRHQKVAIRSGHGVGKTRGLAWLFWWFMICWKVPGRTLKIPCTGPTGGNLEDVLWPEISLVHGHLPKYFQDQFIVMNDHVRYAGTSKEWFGSLRTARKENPDAFQGFHAEPVLAMIDEASGVHDKIFEVGTGVLSSDDAYAVMTGNPTKLSGHFYRTFANPSGNWYLMHVDCRNELNTQLQRYNYVDELGNVHEIAVPGRVSQKLIDHVYNEYGEHSPEADVRVRGDFPESETASIIRKEWTVEPKITYENEWLEPHAKRILGLDPADISATDDSGDESACVIRVGKNIEEVDSVRGRDQIGVGQWIVGKYFDMLKNGKKIDIINVDCTGVGAGAWAAIKNDPAMKKEIRAKRVRVTRVMMQESAPEDAGARCYRMRDFMWWQMRLFFQHKTQYFAGKSNKYAQLLEDVRTPLYDTKTGKVKVESKRDIRKRTGRSPDYADALMLTFYGSENKKPEKKTKAQLDPHRRKARAMRAKRESESWKVI